MADTSFSTDFIVTSDIASNNGLTGGGDRDTDTRHHPPRPTRRSSGGTKIKTKKFWNGVHVPVFYASDEEEIPPKFPSQNPKLPEVSESTLPAMDKDKVTEMMDQYFACPICTNYMVEATAVSCGHTFCASCIKKWSAIKPICPICATQIQGLIRLYNEDLFIEDVMGLSSTFPEDFNQRLKTASKTRMELRLLERKNIFGKIRRNLDDTLRSLKCKGVLTTMKNSRVSQAIRRRWVERRWQPQTQSAPNLTLATPPLSSKIGSWGAYIIGAVLGGLLVWSFYHFQLGESNFLRYCYLSVKKYDGEIPSYLMSEEDFRKSDVIAVDLQPDLQKTATRSWWSSLTSIFSFD